VCALRESCSSFDMNRTYGSVSVCQTRNTANCEAALAASGTAQTPALEQACAAAYPSEQCTDFFDGNPVPACVAPAGPGQTSATCSFSAQCASTFCALGQYQVCGTCLALPDAGASSSCTVAAECGRNLGCAIPANTTTGTCSTYAPQGAPCLTGSQLCASALACVGDDPTTSTNGTCQTAGASVGAACDASRKTAANCNGTLGFVCIPKAAGSEIGTCQNITLAAPGAPCGDIGSNPITGFADCQAGGLCAKPLTDAGKAANTGVCVAPAADGAACDSDPTTGPPCLSPAKCVASSPGGTAGTCLLPGSTTSTACLP
jgi:hypothetical protein